MHLPHALRVAQGVPPGRIVAPAAGAWKITAVEVSAPDRAAGAKVEITANGPQSRVNIRAPANRTVTWKLTY